MFHQPGPIAHGGLAPATFQWRLGRSQQVPDRWHLCIKPRREARSGGLGKRCCGRAEVYREVGWGGETAPGSEQWCPISLHCLSLRAAMGDI